MECNTLPVNICKGDRIIVHKNQAAHAASGQGLHCMRSNSAHPEYGYCGVLKGIHSLGAYEHFSSGKFIYHNRNNSCILFVFMIV